MSFASRMGRISLALSASAVIMLALAALAAPAHAVPGDLQITRFEVTPQPSPLANPGTQAGAHPNTRIYMRFCDPENNTANHGCIPTQSTARLRDFILRLPPGMLGNPTVVPECPTHLFLAATCPPESVVGFSVTTAIPGRGTILTIPTPLYRIAPLGLEPARLGTTVLPSTPPGPLPVVVTLRTDEDYGITSAINGIPPVLGGVAAKIIDIDTVLCAQAPCQGSYDPVTKAIAVNPLPGSTVPIRPFFLNPTSCDKEATVRFEASSWPIVPTLPTTNQFAQAGFLPTGCENVPFDPTVDITPTDTTQAGAPSGYKVAIRYPDYADATPWQSMLRHADVTLPQGIALSPAGGVGLEACSDAQFGIGDSLPVECPEGSDIGDIRVESPAVPDALGGQVFFGPTGGALRPTEANPWKLFLLIEGAGLRIKLAGEVSVDASGRIRTKFLNNPEVPFSRFELNLQGGDNAVLLNPSDCEPHAADIQLYGFSGAVQPVNTVVQATGCPATRGFSPKIEEASAAPEQAGAFSRSRLVLTRADLEQNFTGLKLSLPPGASGGLAGIPLCPKADALAGNCRDASRVGNLRNTVGFGNGLLTVPGSLYLGEPLERGDAASFIIVVPAKVGPIDLGKVVIPNRVRLRPEDTGIDVISGNIPTILEGVPLPIRRVEINVDRERFFRNPTGCDTRTFVGTFSSDQGATSVSRVALAAKGCDALDFSPTLRMIAGGRGQTKTNANVPLKAIVTQEPSEASIAKARVVVPDLIRPDVPQIQKPGALCNEVQLATRTCPPLSEIGSAKVVTPLLPYTLSGPVYIVLRAGSPLPNLAVFLRGGDGLEVLLTAGNGFQGIKILNTFDTVPDVPQSYFELNVKGGSNGILLAHSDLCRAQSSGRLPEVDARFTGHNAKVKSSKPRLQIDGCATTSQLGRASIATRSVRVTRKGIAPIRLRCPTGRACSGRLSLAGGKKSFRIAAGKSKVVRVKLSRKSFRSLKRKRSMRVRAKLILSGNDARKTISLKAPRKRR